MSAARALPLPAGITLGGSHTLAEVKALLVDCRLPIDDINDNVIFVVARTDHGLCGTAGLETYGAIGLVRSVAVRAASRGNGIARALCDEIIRRATEGGVRRLFLLTTDAQALFRGLGFAEVRRDSLPPAIRETAQFRELCPQTATAMVRDA